MTLFTSEQVSCGHPDKICDQISDAILDAYLTQDPYSRVAVETLIKNNNIVVAGEISSQGDINVNNTIFSVLDDIGVNNCNYQILNLLDKQSPDIALGVDIGGAGDQGIMFGYACDETPECLPLAYVLATDALKRLRALNHPMLRPDAKSQVTVRYEDGKPIAIDTFLVSTQHAAEIGQAEVREIVYPLLKESAAKYNMNLDFKVLVNPTGRFVIGGSFGDAGVTGRKIIADSYGGYARHGGGCYSGKDSSKVDRSAAYMARYIAKWLLKLCDLKECEVQIGYAIGIAEPVSVNIRTNTSQNFEPLVRSTFDLTPNGIISFLDLRRPIYYDTAKYGHFIGDYTWERV